MKTGNWLSGRSVLISPDALMSGSRAFAPDQLSAIHPAGLRITYVESSFNMMTLSKKRDWRQNDVVFVQLPAEQFDTQERYDCILTGFFFDNFSKQAAETIFLSLHRFLTCFTAFHYRGFIKSNVFQK